MEDPSEKQIRQIADILMQWNPLGEKAKSIPDLDGYRTEAEDIAFGLDFIMQKTSVIRMTRDVLNDAFDLNLTLDDCRDAAKKIEAVLQKSNKA